MTAENRRMCPNCRAFIGASDRACQYCGVQLGPRAAAAAQTGQILGGLIPQAHFTTILILLINLGLFIASYMLSRTMGDNRALWALGAKFGPSIFQDHEWWRLVTAGFLHGGFLHIAMNSWVLYDGTPRFLVIYFLGTIGGFYLSAIMKPMELSIGSSAGLTGLIGAMIAFGVANRSSVGREIRNFYVRWVVYILAIGFIGGFGIDNWAHIGGLAAGFAAGYLAGTPMRSNRANESVWRLVAGGCIAVTVFCFLMVWRNFSHPIG